MYQIKYKSGYEILVNGNLCKVYVSTNGPYRELFSGTYDACVRFLAERGIS